MKINKLNLLLLLLLLLLVLFLLLLLYNIKKKYLLKYIRLSIPKGFLYLQ